MLFNALLLALREMRRNMLRSFLTVLGIVIGVAAVIVMVTMGKGATYAVADKISSLGTNLLTLRPGQSLGPSRDTAGAPNFKKADVDAIRTQIKNLQVVVPVLGSSVTLVAGNNNWATNVQGTTNDYLLASNWGLSMGREFSAEEESIGKPVCIMGATVRKELFGTRNPLGEEVRVKTFACQIIGLLIPKGQGAFGIDMDDKVLMPINTVQRRLVGNQDVTSIMISMRDGANTKVIIEQINALMRERRKLGETEANDFDVRDTKQLAEILSGTIATMTGLLGAVAAVSMLVGGIGIMNIMLVSVTERTREIGIRLAIGALEQEVLWQFLIEAVVLSSFGGIVGIILAFFTCLALTKPIQIPFQFNLEINLLSFCFSAAIGVIFGFMPARRVARLDPIVALRHE